MKDMSNSPSIYYDVFPWRQPIDQFATVKLAHGCAIVVWPSGRVTLEQYGGSALLTELEIALLGDRSLAMARKETNLQNTMADYRSRVVRSSYWIRLRRGRRQKARKIISANFGAPSRYYGPIPGRGGVVNCDSQDQGIGFRTS